jgi:hypothetical protein
MTARTLLFCLFFFAICGASGLGCAASDSAIDGDDSASIDQAICSASEKNAYVAIKEGGGGGGGVGGVGGPSSGETEVDVFSDASRRTVSMRLPIGTTLLRKTTRELDADAPFSQVEIKSGPNKGRVGWIDATKLTLRSPATGACENGTDFEAKGSAFERAQSAIASDDTFSAGLLKSTVACASGLDEGFEGGFTSLRAGIEALGRGAWEVLKEIVERDRLLILYTFGNGEARNKLSARGAMDEEARQRDIEGVQAAAAMIGHAIPTIHQYLSNEHVYYQALEAPEQSRYMCKLIGRITFEAVVAIGTAAVGGAVKTQSALKAEAIIADANMELSKVANIPGRVGDSAIVKVPRTFAGTKRGAYWKRLMADLDRLPSERDPKKIKAIIRHVSDDINVPYRAYKVGERVNRSRVIGNCGNSALATIFSLSSGALSCPLPYFTLQNGAMPVYRDALEAFEGGVLQSSTPWSKGVTLEARLQSELAEGQMAWIASVGTKGSHATAAIKLDGRVYSINNQGWEKKLGLGDDDLQLFSDWVSSWKSMDQYGALDSFRAHLTTLKLTGR